MPERTGAVTFKGGPLTLIGGEVRPGDKAPDFICQGNDMAAVSLGAFRGKTLVLVSVPSLDTAVCDRETHRFNEEAMTLGDNVRVVVVSMDLPFAQKRWCGAAGVKNVLTLSDHADASFGKAYGVLIKELRLLARCVFVVDADGAVRYVQLVKEMTTEPDYAGVLDAVRKVQAGK